MALGQMTSEDGLRPLGDEIRVEDAKISSRDP